jgi:hypothetical protein
LVPDGHITLRFHVRHATRTEQSQYSSGLPISVD